MTTALRTRRRTTAGATHERDVAWVFIRVLATALVLILVLSPIAMLLYGSFRTAPPAAHGSFTLAQYGQLFFLHDGRVLQQRVYYPDGDPRGRLSLEDLERKFRDGASLALPSAQVEEVAEQVRALERSSSLRPLAAALRADAN